MKIIKKILTIVLSLIILIFIIAAVSSKKYDVERSITINLPKSDVFDYIKYVKNQDNFSVWAEMDPDAKKSFTGQDGTVGFISAWESQVENVGKGEQEIKNITPGTRIDFELRFIEPFESTDQAYFRTESLSENSTRVLWGFYGALPIPMNLMLYFMDMDEQLGPDLEKGLQNLKILLEAK